MKFIWKSIVIPQFIDLPNEIHLTIFNYLPNDFGKFLLISKRLNNLVEISKNRIAFNILNNFNLVSDYSNSFEIYKMLYIRKFINCDFLFKKHDDELRIKFINQALKNAIDLKNTEICKFLVLNSFRIDLFIINSYRKSLFDILKYDDDNIQLLLNKHKFDHNTIFKYNASMNFLQLLTSLGRLKYST
jgi:hypothetical protein